MAVISWCPMKVFLQFWLPITLGLVWKQPRSSADELEDESRHLLCLPDEGRHRIRCSKELIHRRQCRDVFAHKDQMILMSVSLFPGG